jgi:hypothetical protein
MNLKILLLAISAATLTSCSSTYKSGQTPDDVYYSPARVVEENYRTETKRERVNEYYQDRGVRMAVYDRRWRDFNDEFDYRYDPYHYGYSYGYYYNPYYCHYPVYFNNIVISNPKNTVPRMTSLGSYNNPSYSISNVKNANGRWITQPRTYNNSNSSSIRRILTTTNSSNNSNYNRNNTSDNNTRSYTPSSSSGSSRSSSSGSGTPVSRPSRGN